MQDMGSKVGHYLYIKLYVGEEEADLKSTTGGECGGFLWPRLFFSGTLVNIIWQFALALLQPMSYKFDTPRAVQIESSAIWETGG